MNKKKDHTSQDNVRRMKSPNSWNLAVIVTVIGGIVIIFNSQINDVLRSNYSIRKQEEYTELHFENHTNLPETVEVGKINNFSFTIGNSEHQKMEYGYSVYAETGGDLNVIDYSIVDLDQGENIIISKDFVLSRNVRTKIVVEIKNINQSISFWMEPEDL